MADAITPTLDAAGLVTDDGVIDDPMVEDVLVEEISIDGMCGVY